MPCSYLKPAYYDDFLIGESKVSWERKCIFLIYTVTSGLVAALKNGKADMASGKPCLPLLVLSTAMEWMPWSESRTESLRGKIVHYWIFLRYHAVSFTGEHTWAVFTAPGHWLTLGLCRSVDSHSATLFSPWYIQELLESLKTTCRPSRARSLALGFSIEPFPSANIALFSLHHIGPAFKLSAEFLEDSAFHRNAQGSKPLSPGFLGFPQIYMNHIPSPIHLPIVASTLRTGGR